MMYGIGTLLCVVCCVLRVGSGVPRAARLSLKSVPSFNIFEGGLEPLIIFFLISLLALRFRSS